MWDGGPVADDHGHGDGLTQSPADRQGDGGRNAGGGTGEYRGADDLPAGPAQRHGRFSIGAGHSVEGGTAQGDHGGQGHDGQHDGG